MVNFGGLTSEYTSVDRATFWVLPVPYDLTSTYQPGSRWGPTALLEASANLELYDEALKRETYLWGVHTLPPLEADARGPVEMIGKVRTALLPILERNKFPVIIGGEHSITVGVVQAMKAKYPALTVVQLDAHADLRDTYQESPFSHATVARRITEMCPLVQVGIRSLSMEEVSFIGKNNIKTFFADFIHEKSSWIEEICHDISGDVYLTIDLDVFDPSIMPATGTPEPDGLTWRQVVGFIDELSRKATIRGFDVMELCPIPGMIAPDFLAAKLTYRLMGYTIRSMELNHEKNE